VLEVGKMSVSQRLRALKRNPVGSASEAIKNLK
jgi:hypothetical protein